LKSTYIEEDVIGELYKYIVATEMNLARINGLKATFKIIRKDLLDLEQLKGKDVVQLLVAQGALAGICLQIQQQLSSFKEDYK
jgi:hypothetical protein